MSDNLSLLAKKLGVATSFSDSGLAKKNYSVSDDLIRFFINSLGYQCTNEEEISASLQQIENERWNSVLQSIYVCKQSKIFFDIVFADTQDINKIVIKNSLHQKQNLHIEQLGEARIRNIGGVNKQRREFYISDKLEVGYYELEVYIGNKNYKSVLAVAPRECYHLADTKEKYWGYALQLYALRSKRNWGVGDFTDLKEFVKICAAEGADIIGLNPLNVLNHTFPENASPYQSISRLFLNPIYIDVTQVAEFEPQDQQQIETQLAELRASDNIEYGKVYPLKMQVLEKCFKRFQSSKNSSRHQEFNDFCNVKGIELEKLALFQSLYEVNIPQDNHGWKSWSANYKSPDAVGITDFAEQHSDRIEFFKFIQFEAERQFNQVKTLIDDLGLAIGLYRDLAVGVGTDSAELWSNPDNFIPHSGAGAPPDAFFPCGQKWGLGAFIPQKLKETAYESFINILRANMKNAGALRIDHVMSLMRLYVIPDDSDSGTYIYYNFEDMLNIVALESYLNKCVIVGESIGNVPEGFVETLREHNIHSLSVLWAERSNSGWGGFLAPYDYPRNAVVSVGTHDMPPLKMWWFGYDIELADSLGLFTTSNQKIDEYHKREADRHMLLSSLDAAGVWPQDNLRKADYLYGENYPEGIDEAVHAYVAQTPCPIFLAQPEDFMHSARRQNMPGTDKEQYPNWRIKLPLNLEDIEQNEQYQRNVAAIRRER